MFRPPRLLYTAAASPVKVGWAPDLGVGLGRVPWQRCLVPPSRPGPAAPGLSRSRLPSSFEGLAARALECDEAARALAAALGSLSDAERGALLSILAEVQGDDFGRLLARLVGASAGPSEARALVAPARRPGHAFRDGDQLFLVARGEPGALEVTAGRVAVHDRFDTGGMEAAPLEPAVDEAAQLLWRHHRGALPPEAERFAGLFDPTPPGRRSQWRS